MAETGLPIHRRAVYRVLVFSFAIWALHFAVAYGAALVFPGQVAARWVAVGALGIAVAVLGFAVRRLRAQTGAIGLAAMALAIGAMVFGTLPAIIG